MEKGHIDYYDELEDTMKGKYLIFAIEQEEYAIEIRYVTEIIEIQPIVSVPKLPSYIKGILNLRGDIIPVMDLRIRFHKSVREYDYKTAIIIVNIQGTRLGLVVDRAYKVLSIDDNNLLAPPEIRESDYNRFIKAIGKVDNNMKLVLDCEKVLTAQELDELASF